VGGSASTIVEMYNEALPFFISIGMSYSQYWESTISERGAYYRAYELSLDRESMLSWLQGSYVIRAVHGNRQGHIDYPKRPIRISSKTERERIVEEMESIRVFRESMRQMTEANMKKLDAKAAKKAKETKERDESNTEVVNNAGHSS